MLRLASVAICLLVVACGDPGATDGGSGAGAGGGGGSSFDPDLPGINGTGTFLTEPERLAVIDAAKRVQSTTPGSWDQQDDAMVVHLREDPKIEAAGISRQNNVWARFIDGTLYLDFSGRDLDAIGLRPHRGFTKGLDLPKTVTAVSANDLEPWWPDSSARIGGWLAGKGYTVAPQTQLRHQDLQAFSGVGVFFWQTHSAEADLRAVLKDANGNVLYNDAGVALHQQAFSFMTSNTLLADSGTPLTPDENLMRNQNLLTVASVSLVQGQRDPWVYHLGVTNAFIEQRMINAFAPNSLVAIDSCTGAVGAPAFKKIGVGAFVAWDDVSGNRSQEQHERLFDRLLGQNAPPASTPLERPFHLDAVTSWMKKKGYDVDPSPGLDGGVNPQPAHLKVFQNTGFGILRPSIQRLLFRSSAAPTPFPKLVVEGTFGDAGTVGTVEWGATTLQQVSWSPSEVVVRVPAGPPYPPEPLVVKVGPRESNPAKLTVWNIPFTYTLTGRGSLKAVATMNCILRSDVRGNRFEPQDTPEVAGSVNASYLLDSNGTITASGSATNPTETWAGGASLGPVPLDGSPAPSKNYVSCNGSFNGATKQLTLLVQVNAAFMKNGTADTGIIQSQFAFPPQGIVIDTVWATRTLVGKTLQGTWPIPNESLSLSWPDVAPVAGTAPTDMDPR